MVTGPVPTPRPIVRYSVLGRYAAYVPFREVDDQLLPAGYTVMQGGYWMPPLRRGPAGAERRTGDAR